MTKEGEHVEEDDREAGAPPRDEPEFTGSGGLTLPPLSALLPRQETPRGE